MLIVLIGCAAFVEAKSLVILLQPTTAPASNSNNPAASDGVAIRQHQMLTAPSTATTRMSEAKRQQQQQLRQNADSTAETLASLDLVLGQMIERAARAERELDCKLRLAEEADGGFDANDHWGAADLHHRAAREKKSSEVVMDNVPAQLESRDMTTTTTTMTTADDSIGATTEAEDLNALDLNKLATAMAAVVATSGTKFQLTNDQNRQGQIATHHKPSNKQRERKRTPMKSILIQPQQPGGRPMFTTDLQALMSAADPALWEQGISYKPKIISTARGFGKRAHW